MNNRKKKFLEGIDKNLKKGECLPHNIHKKTIFFQKENYSSYSVKYTVLIYQVMFRFYHFLFLIFIWCFKRKPLFLVKIHKALLLAPDYGAVILDDEKRAWIDRVVEQLQINKEDKILLVNSLCINYNKKNIGYNNQKSFIDIVFFCFLSFLLALSFIVYSFLFILSVDLISYKLIVGILFLASYYKVLKFFILSYKAIIFDANNIIERRKYFINNLS